MSINRVSISIDQTREDQATAAIDGLVALFPELVTLDTVKRKRVPKLSRRKQDFIESGMRHAEQNPHLVPSYADIAESKVDIGTIESMKRIGARLRAFVKSVDDTLLLLQADAYETSLAFYNSVKAAARHGEEGAERIADDLSYHFKRKKKKKEEDTPPPDSNAAAVAVENPQQNA